MDIQSVVVSGAINNGTLIFAGEFTVTVESTNDGTILETYDLVVDGEDGFFYTTAEAEGDLSNVGGVDIAAFLNSYAGTVSIDGQEFGFRDIIIEAEEN